MARNRTLDNRRLLVTYFALNGAFTTRGALIV
jgi:hypothetical protein